MLQRIQTVYLLIIAVLTMIMMFLPLATLQSSGEFYKFDISGLSTVGSETVLGYPTWGLFVLTIIIAILPLITIFLFKKRVLQIRLCIFNALLMIGFYVYVGFLLWTFKQQFVDVSIMVKLAISFPIIGLILDYLAIRNIGADEALVRSLERLR